MRPSPAGLLGAVGLDLAVGEPPDRWHPVAWIGRVLAWADRRAPARTRASGAAAVVTVVAGAWLLAAAVATLARRSSRLGPLLEAVALKPNFPKARVWLERLGDAP